MSGEGVLGLHRPGWPSDVSSTPAVSCPELDHGTRKLKKLLHLSWFRNPIPSPSPVSLTQWGNSVSSFVKGGVGQDQPS